MINDPLASGVGNPGQRPAAPLRHVAVGLIVAGDGRVLLQHRDERPDVPGPGLWGFFGGHVEPGETAAQAFQREMDEELGWRPRHFEPYLTREVASIGAGSRDTTVVSHVFAAHLDVGLEALMLGEGQGMALYAPDALPAGVVASIVPVIADFAASDAYKRVRHAWDAISATGILVGPDGRFLLQHRDDKPEIMNPGLWGSFGGEIEPYETPGDGFVRELREELAFEPRSYELFASAPYRLGERRALIYVYAAPVEMPIDDLVLGEGQGMAFFALDELPAETVPDYRALLRRFAGSEMYAEMMRRATA